MQLLNAGLARLVFILMKSRLHAALLSMSLCVALTGCVGITPHYSAEEYEKLSTRTYSNKSSEEVYAASRKVFELADAEHFHITRFGNELRASRTRFFTFIDNTFEWRILAEPQPNGVKVSAHVVNRIGSAEVRNPTGKAIYDLFFTRLDYLLGVSSTWRNCNEADEQIYKEKGIGEVSALCFGADDKYPNGLLDPRIQNGA